MGRGGGEREKLIDMKEYHGVVASHPGPDQEGLHMLRTEIRPTTRVCALTGRGGMTR